MTFTHKLLSGPREQIPAMNRVLDLLDSLDFSADAFALANAYGGWSTDEVIAWETTRNLLVGMAIVFLVTLVVMMALLACLWVMVCVVLTLVRSF